MRHVVLVGATDGMGLALAREYAGRSWRVAVMGRDRDKVQDVVNTLSEEHPGGTVVGGVLDVADAEAVVPALESTLDTLGQMDLLVYCAGVLEETSTGRPADTAADTGPGAHPVAAPTAPDGSVASNAARSMFAVNTLGAIAVMEWAACYFVQAGQGHVAALGSVAGDRGRKGNPAYGASKAALHQYLEGMRARLHPHGVRVSTVKPGWVRTRMLGDVPGFPPSISAPRAAELIRRGLDAGRESFYVPAWWEVVTLVLRLMPRFLFKRMAPP